MTTTLEAARQLAEQNGRFAVRARDTAGAFTLRSSDPLVRCGLVATIATCIGIAWLGLRLRVDHVGLRR